MTLIFDKAYQLLPEMCFFLKARFGFYNIFFFKQKHDSKFFFFFDISVLRMMIRTRASILSAHKSRICFI